MLFASVLLSAVIVGAFGTCVPLNCPSTAINIQPICNNCSHCLLEKSRFCAVFSNGTCQCAGSIPSACSRALIPNSVPITYCSSTGNIPLPPPQIHRDGNAAISVTVPRFFTQPEFEGKHPSNLLLLAHFYSPASTVCRDVHAIQAQRRGESECILRVKLAMPGVDHKTDDHYYYDDGTDMETSFSLEIFEGANEATFWTEVTIQQMESTSKDKLSFFSRLRSSPVKYTILHTTGTPSSTLAPSRNVVSGPKE